MWLSFFDLDGLDLDCLIDTVKILLLVFATFVGVGVVQTVVDQAMSRVKILNQGEASDASQPGGHTGTGGASASAVALRAMADKRANKARGRG